MVGEKIISLMETLAARKGQKITKQNQRQIIIEEEYEIQIAIATTNKFRLRFHRVQSRSVHVARSCLCSFTRVVITYF